MDIKKTGFLNKILRVDKKKTNKVSKSVQNDSVNISDEAKLMAEAKKVQGLLNKVPDIREKKISQIREKLKNEAYMSQEVYDAVADKLSRFIEEI